MEGRRMRWVGHMSGMRKKRNIYTQFLSGNLKESDPLENLGTDWIQYYNLS